jgi:F-type H+-transporting ATPase subunit epsilon
MAVDKIDLEIVTPERLVLSETVDEVILPGADGYLGVLPGHAPLLTGMMSGEVSYRVGDRARYLAVSGGFAEVLRNKVTVLAETCERAEEIDLDRAKLAREKAEKVISDLAAEVEMEEAGARLKRALARIQVGQRNL